jgi:DNA-binding transcriptional ArsR family regulator
MLINVIVKKLMTDLSTTFAALGDATRFTIVERLLREGQLSAGDLQQGTSITAPAISRHLKVLRKAGILEQRIDRQRRLYSVRPQAVEAISAWTMSHREFWRASLDRLEKALDREIKLK